MATHSSILAWRIPRTEEPVDLCTSTVHGVSKRRTELKRHSIQLKQHMHANTSDPTTYFFLLMRKA